MTVYTGGRAASKRIEADPATEKFRAIEAEPYSVASSASTAIGAIDWPVIPRAPQYVDSSHLLRDFVPLLALQATQQSAIFSELTSDRSLTICSHEGQVARPPIGSSKVKRQ